MRDSEPRKRNAKRLVKSLSVLDVNMIQFVSSNCYQQHSVKPSPAGRQVPEMIPQTDSYLVSQIQHENGFISVL